MGQANITCNVGISRLRLFNAYQKKNFKAFLEDVTEEYLEEDDIKVLLTDYSRWIATTSIPKYSDEYLRSNSTIFLNASTLNNYLSNFIIMLTNNFPKHYVWEETKWTTRMSVEEFDKKFKREQGRSNVDLY